MSLSFRRRRGVLEWRDTHQPVVDAHTLQIVETNAAVAKALVNDAWHMDLQAIADKVVRP